MASKEFMIIFSGAVTIMLVISMFNLVLKLNIALSLLVSIILGITIGLIINSIGKPLKPLSLILGIIAWCLIGFAVLGIILKWLGIISSPPFIEILLGAVLVELLRVENRVKEFAVKQSILWNDFRKRKEI